MSEKQPQTFTHDDLQLEYDRGRHDEEVIAQSRIDSMQQRLTWALEKLAKVREICG